MKDIVYIYDKINFTRQELGEIQKSFNLSFVIDGTKDSAKIIIKNYSGIEVEAYSIIKHKTTNTWWVVSHDKVIRYENEDRVEGDETIPTYYYEHEIELLGAIELFNARDLTDCGFNQNRYTVEEVINRLLKLSTFEFKNNFTLYTQRNVDGNKTVDYVKTFENYTLLSALREFLDGYNCAIKLEFNESPNGTLTSANLLVVSKTGNYYGEVYNEDDFNKVEEVKTLDKNSFGTSVVSNAENVISTKTKTYPSMGSAKITGTQDTITNKTAVVRLPSNAFRVNWVEFQNYQIPVLIYEQDGADITEVSGWGYTSDIPNKTYNVSNAESIHTIYEEIKSKLNDLGGSAMETAFTTNFKEYRLSEYGKRRFYYTDKYDPINKKFISDYPIVIRETWVNTRRQTILSNSEIKSNFTQGSSSYDDVIYFERGKNFIKGFDMFGESGVGLNKARFVPIEEGIVFQYTTTSLPIKVYYVVIGDAKISQGTVDKIDVEYVTYNLSSMGVVVNYVPMSDIKIKVDNTLDKRDSQFYNQNGKLTDSVALSKMLLSHSKEIQSDTITKNAVYYYKNVNGTITSNIPSIGSLVNINNDIYVINNVSLTFVQNEVDNDSNEIGYFVSCEFTMSKGIAVKSMLTTPNTNIRDYGIPQNNNVARKQLYRDFYELGYEEDSDDETPFLTLDKVLNVSNEYAPYQEHTAVIKLSFNGSYGSDPKNTWYYQLESTTFVMKKMIYEVINFNDNNIIGYSNQNVWSGFNIKRIITGSYDLANTPISYVDDYGEVESISIALCTNIQLTSIYKDYISASGSENSKYGAFYSCFIPEQIYEGGNVENQDTPPVSTTIVGAKDNNDFMIIETNYEKDALEVPVFEYSCQIDDSDKVIIGSNILDNYEQDNAYLYSYVFVDKNKYNDNNYGLNTINKPSISSSNIATINNAVKMIIDNGRLKIKLYASMSYDLINNEETSLGNQIAFDTTKDLMIIRHRILESDLYLNPIGELIGLKAYTDSGDDALPNASSLYYGKYAVKTDDNYYECQKEEKTGLTKLYNISNEYTYNSITGQDNFPTFSGSQQAINNGKCIAVKYEYVDTSNMKPLVTTSIVSISSGNDPSQAGYSASDYNGKYIVSTPLYLIWGELAPISGLGYNPLTYVTQAQLDDINNNYIQSYRDKYIVVQVIVGGTEQYQLYKGGVGGFAYDLPDGGFGTYYFDYAGSTYLWSQAEERFNLQPVSYTLWLSQYGAWQNRYVPSSTDGIFYTDSTHFYQWNDVSSFVSVSVSVNDYMWKLYRYVMASNSWVIEVNDLSSDNNFYDYNNLYYKWNNSQEQWVDNSTYQWVEIGNASNQYFTYQGDLFKYISTSNVFEQIGDYSDIDREDLMFICRDLDNAPIDTNTNELSLYINYYRTY